MPCLFLHNVPKKVAFDPEVCDALYLRIAEAAGVTPDAVEVHIVDTTFRLLGRDGNLNEHGVHGWMEWHAGRTLEAKQAIGTAIHEFLVHHDIGKGSDITFVDYPGGTFFYEGKLVHGGPPSPWSA